MDYTKLSIEALEARNQEIMASRADLRREQRELVAVLDIKRAASALDEDMKKLEQRHGVKAQVIAPAGIDSAEVVNGTG